MGLKTRSNCSVQWRCTKVPSHIDGGIAYSNREYARVKPCGPVEADYACAARWISQNRITVRRVVCTLTTYNYERIVRRDCNVSQGAEAIVKTRLARPVDPPIREPSGVPRSVDLYKGLTRISVDTGTEVQPKDAISIAGHHYPSRQLSFGCRVLHVHNEPRINCACSGIHCCKACTEFVPNPEEIACKIDIVVCHCQICLLYTSPSPRDGLLSRMPSSA